MEWIIQVIKSAPELAIFLALALGVAIGKVKIKKFSLGSVTGVLLMGVLIGQLDLSISPVVKSTFFLLFLFAVGYSVGPQFVQSLRKGGIPQILFAFVVCTACLLTSWVIALIAGFDIGSTVGLLSGANTISAVIGVATDTINQLPIGAAQKSGYLNNIPVAYAVTYIFGTAGTAWFLSSVGPKILGGDIIRKTKEYEASMGGAIQEDDASLEYAYSGVTFRVVEANSSFFDTDKTIKEVEDFLLTKGWPVFIERIRKQDSTIVEEPNLEDIIHRGDKLVLNGPLDTILSDEDFIGTEVADIELLGFQVEVLKIIVANKEWVGTTLENFKHSKDRHGVVVRAIHRGQTKIPLLNNVEIQQGDVFEVEGRKSDVDRFAKHLGFADRPTNVTDLLYVGLGIFIGGILGSLTARIGSVPLSLSSSGGVLIMGIVFGWLRSRRPTFGAIPEPAVWLMNNLGLTAFIAIVGISAGPQFVSGLKESGLPLFIAGIFASLVPMIVGLFAGKYIFKFHPAITLGACAGSRTTTAALGAIEDSIQSNVPALSYTTTYAVGNTLLIIWGVVIVLLMS